MKAYKAPAAVQRLTAFRLEDFLKKMEQHHPGKIQGIKTIVCTERRAIRPNRVENTFAAR